MKNAWRTIAIGAVLSVAATAAPSLAVTLPAAQDENRDHAQVQQTQQQPDYSNNRYYKIGNREGYQDYKSKHQRADHNHNYRNQTDRQAHDYGYQQGLQGQRGYPGNGNNQPH